MTMSALAEKREPHILKKNEDQSKGEDTGNNHVQMVKDFFAAMRNGDMQALLAVSAGDRP